MILHKKFILGVSVTTSSKKQILSYCSSVFSKSSKKSFPIIIVTPNAEQIVLAQKNEDFRRILNASDVALPDGKPLEWILRRETKSVQRISGIDFMVDLCHLAVKKGERVLLYGGRGDSSNQALTELKKELSGLDGIAIHAPEFSDTQSMDVSIMTELAQTIRSRNIRVVFIGLGAPKQEYLMDVLKKRLAGERVILMVVGGSFDVLAGKIKRAPKYVQTIGFEWLWRLIQEPWRWQRQLALLHFIQLVLLSKIRDN